jgi:hypothetical protein
VVLTLVIGQVFLPWVTIQGIHFLGYFVPNPEKFHFHRSGMLMLECVVPDAHCYGIVADKGFWLRMAHIG